MALEILYSPQFSDNLEAILSYFDKHNGSDTYSRKLIRMIHEQILLFVENYGIEYQIRDTAILVVDIYSCRTDPTKRSFKKR